jgi:HEAT repeat protein
VVLVFVFYLLAQPPQGQAQGLAPPKGLDIAPLREMLHDRNRPQEQSQAALLLIQSESDETRAFVTFELTNWDRPDVFQALASAIKLRRDLRYLNPMLDALGAEQPLVRQPAIETLANLPSEKMHDPLQKIAQEHTSPPLRRLGAIEALGRVASKACVTSLLKLLRCDSLEVRHAAAAALQDVSGQDFGADPNQWEKWWQNYQDFSEQDWQANRLRFIANNAHRLRDELDLAESNLLKLHKELLDKVLAPDLVSYLQQLVTNPYPAVRELAVGKIAEQLNRKDLERKDRKLLTETLLKLSHDSNIQVQQRVVLAMEKTDDPAAYSRLIALLKDRSAKVRAASASSLGNFRGTASSPQSAEQTLLALESCLQDPSPSVVAEAATSIGSLRLPRSGEILAQLLHHPTEEVRKASSAALEGIATCQVYSEVMHAVDDASAETRLFLVGCLGRIGEYSGMSERESTDLISKLQKILIQDGDPGVRSKAAATLGKVGRLNEISILWQRVQANEDSRVQENAWKALIDIFDRQQNWPTVYQWERFLETQGQQARRLQLLTDLRERWSKQNLSRENLDQLSSALIDAALAQRKWREALPVCLDLIRSAAQETLRDQRLRLLLIICQQAVQDHKGIEVLSAMKEVEPMLTGFKELSVSFETLHRQIESGAK